jgi:hypothetical protein
MMLEGIETIATASITAGMQTSVGTTNNTASAVVLGQFAYAPWSRQRQLRNTALRFTRQWTSETDQKIPINTPSLAVGLLPTGAYWHYRWNRFDRKKRATSLPRGGLRRDWQRPSQRPLGEWDLVFSTDATPPFFSIWRWRFQRALEKKRRAHRSWRRSFTRSLSEWIQAFSRDQVFPIISTFLANARHRKRRVTERRARKHPPTFGWIEQFSQDQIVPFVSTFIATARHRKRRVVERRARKHPFTFAWPQFLSVDQVFPTFSTLIANVRHRKRRIVERRARKHPPTMGWIQGFSRDQVLPRFASFIANARHRKRRVVLRRERRYKPPSVGWLQAYSIIVAPFQPMLASFRHVKRRLTLRLTKRRRVEAGWIAYNAQDATPPFMAPGGVRHRKRRLVERVVTRALAAARVVTSIAVFFGLAPRPVSGFDTPPTQPGVANESVSSSLPTGEQAPD